jgi:hypothetical protein
MKTECEKCNKPTWKGCGKHIEQALKDVPEDERCKCSRDPPASTATESKETKVETTANTEVKTDEAKVETTAATEVKTDEAKVETTANTEVKTDEAKVETTATTEETKEKVD